jgi:poly-gamma-glutamate synthesis protein (capsule biosynthesis protein)
VGGKVVVFGMGNLLSNQTERPATQDGVVIHLDLVEGADGRFAVGTIRYTPTRVEIPGHVIRRVGPASDPASFQRTTQALGLLGGFDGTATTG